MPKQGQSVESCILTELKKKKGDKVSVGDILFAYETDKASFEEESKIEGEILDLFFNEGDEIPVLTNVLVIGKAGESVDEFKPQAGGAAAASAPSAGAESAQPSAAQAGGGFAAAAASAERSTGATVQPVRTDVVGAAPAGTSPVSPRAKAIAEKHGIDASTLRGSGPGGRVIERDVAEAVENCARMTPLAKMMAAENGSAAPARGTGLAGAVRSGDLMAAGSAGAGADNSTIKPLTNMRKLIAKAMHASLQNSAQLTHHLGADARRMMELRKKVKDSGSKVNITLNDMVCFAVVKALKKFPQANSHFLGDSVRLFQDVHLALAVDTERGLMVPVVRNADRLSIGELSQKFKEVAEACRTGSVNPDLLSSEAASFTVSNLGNYGVEVFTPIINLPQAAILGVNTILPRPKDLGDGVYAFVPHIGLSLTYDHRALDGGEATRFLKQIAIEIENLEFEI